MAELAFLSPKASCMPKLPSLRRAMASVAQRAVGFPALMASIEELEEKIDAITRSLASASHGEPGKITRDHVLWAYRLILGREAEGEDVIASKMALKGPRELLFTMLDSEEFRRQALPSLLKVAFKRSPTKCVITELNDGARFWINLRDAAVSQGILNGMRESAEAAFVRRNIKAGMHALDVDAKLGWFTVHMSKLVGDNGSVTAIEPRNDLYHYLCKTVVENKLSNVTIRNCALGAEDAEGWFVDDRDPGYDLEDGIAREKAPLRILDNLLQHRVDFIRIDVEGAEKRVFDGAASIFRADRPIILSAMSAPRLADVSHTTIDDYFAYLESKNYNVFELTDDGRILTRMKAWPSTQFKSVNVALIPAETNLTPV